MIGLCLGLAGIVWAELPFDHFTLVWHHSIELVPWEEDYRVTPDGLVLTEARIKGAGAGMEPPDGAEYRDGAWHYRPELPPIQPLRLARTPEAGDYTMCLGGVCHPLAYWIGPPRIDHPEIELWSCRLAGGPGRQ
jgi:hypothetical protein